MKDLQRALERRSDRGDPIGSERLRQRVAFELAGGHVRPEDTHRRLPGPVLASAVAAIVTLGIGGVMLLRSPDDSVEVATTAGTTTTSAPATTVPAPPGIVWAEAVVPTGIWITTVVEGGPGLVAAGCDLERTESENIYGDRLHGFVEYAAIWTSTDGSTWTPRIADDETRRDAGCIWDLVDTPHGLVGLSTAASVDGVVWLSADGVAWERVTPDSMADAVASRVTVGQDGRLVAAGWIGLEALVWTSTDGRSWTAVADDDLAGRAFVNEFAASPGGLLMVGSDRSSEFFTKPVAWHSANGDDWDRVPATEFESADPLSAVEGLVNVQALPDGTWLVADGPGRIWQSDDARTWGLAYEQNVTGDPIPGLGWVFSGDRLVTVGDGTGVWISIDGGTTWYQDPSVGIPPEVTIDGVFRFGDALVAVGSESPVFTAPDPENRSSTRLWIGTWDG